MKLFLSDLDGTLLFQKQDIHSKDIEAIQNLKKAGYLFGFATGREYGFCKDLIKRYDLPVDVLILNNGGSVFVHERRVREMILHKEELQRILTFIRPYVGDLHPFICDENRVFYLMRKSYDTKGWENVKKALHILGEIKEEDILDMLPGFDVPIIKLSIYVEDERKTQTYLSLLRDKFGQNYEVLMTSPDYIEFTQKGVHKGNALLQLERELHMKAEDVVFIGDGENDVTLMKLAGKSFVMDTAQEHVKQYGDHIVHSVAEAIDHII